MGWFCAVFSSERGSWGRHRDTEGLFSCLPTGDSHVQHLSTPESDSMPPSLCPTPRRASNSGCLPCQLLSSYGKKRESEKGLRLPQQAWDGVHLGSTPKSSSPLHPADFLEGATLGSPRVNTPLYARGPLALWGAEGNTEPIYCSGVPRASGLHPPALE